MRDVLIFIFYYSASQNVVPGPVAEASPGNFLEMQVLVLLYTYGIRKSEGGDPKVF